MVQPKTILCINDRIRFVDIFRSYFEECGYHVLTASTGTESIRLLKGNKVDAIVLDYEAREMSGVAARQLSKTSRPKRRF